MSKTAQKHHELHLTPNIIFMQRSFNKHQSFPEKVEVCYTAWSNKSYFERVSTTHISHCTQWCVVHDCGTPRHTHESLTEIWNTSFGLCKFCSKHLSSWLKCSLLIMMINLPLSIWPELESVRRHSLWARLWGYIQRGLPEEGKLTLQEWCHYTGLETDMKKAE